MKRTGIQVGTNKTIGFEFNIDDFNKRNSKIEEKNINKFINSEYEDEKNINLNNKFRILEDKIDKLLKNQQLIMNKLEINI